MRILFNTIVTRYDPPIEEVLPRLRAWGYDGIELWSGHLAGRSDDEIAALKARVNDCGLPVEVVSPYLSFLSPEGREQTKAFAESALGWAALLGARLIRTFTNVDGKLTDFRGGELPKITGPWRPSAEATDDDYEAVAQALDDLARANPDRLFVIETHPNTLVDSLSGTKRLLSRLAAPNVQLLYQEFNDVGIEEGLEAVFPRIRHVHVHPTTTRYAERTSRVVSWLARRGYDGAVSVEGVGRPALENAPRAVEVIRGLLAAPS